MAPSSSISSICCSQCFAGLEWVTAAITIFPQLLFLLCIALMHVDGLDSRFAQLLGCQNVDYAYADACSGKVNVLRVRHFHS